MLTDLRLVQFRCFSQLTFQPDSPLTFVVGENAQGKTSILEAICVLLRLQSPKASSLAESVGFGHAGFSLDGQCHDRHLRLKFERSLKSFALDSKPQSRSADYLSVARVAWISNDDMQLVRGSGSGRRRYLDFLGTQAEPGYLRHLRSYERALRSRNALLKDQRPRREIAAFDGPLLESGQALLDARARLSLQIQPLVAQSYQDISGGREVLSVTYQPGCPTTFAEALAASLPEETRLRSTTCGPHRDDLIITLNERPAAVFASEGQQRSVALALKLGQASVLGAAVTEPPIYLIDDVFGELDAHRRNNLLQALPAHAQKVITTTSLHWVDSDTSASIFQLANSTLQKVK